MKTIETSGWLSLVPHCLREMVGAPASTPFSLFPTDDVSEEPIQTPTENPQPESARRQEDPPAAPEHQRVEPPPPVGQQQQERPGALTTARAVSASASPPELPLTQIAAQVMRGISVHQLGNQTTLKMELSTPRLSRVELDLSVESGRLNARFHVPDLAGRELLRSSVAELAAGLGARGVEVEAIQVELAPQEAARGKGGQRQEGRRQQEQRGRRGDGRML